MRRSAAAPFGEKKSRVVAVVVGQPSQVGDPEVERVSRVAEALPVAEILGLRVPTSLRSSAVTERSPQHQIAVL